jgi:hypothetical protein
MNNNDVYELYQTMERENILLSFKGVVTSELLSSVLSIMESKMDYMEESPKTKKKVFNVLVECLQNLYHHIEPNEAGSQTIVDSLEAKSALFLIAKKEENFFISTGNYIDIEHSEELNRRLEIINGMEKEELKAYYQEVLNGGSMSARGTAGLGMIDIARKSGNKLDYKFLDVSNDTKFFCLNIKIN